MKSVIGFIGVGAMGTPMALNLLKAGYGLMVYDKKEEATQSILKAGAAQATSPREVAGRCPVIITMLPASPIVEAVVLGTDGVIQGAKPNSIVIDMSSSYPTSTKMISEKLRAKGIRMIDAPVSGGTRGANDASLTIMVGGEAKDFEECQPILQAMGKTIYHVGGTGTGHAMKAINNLCSAGTVLITAEALVVATKFGLSPKKVIDIINSSTGRSWASQFKFPNFVLNDAFNSGFPIGLMSKDLEMATRMGRELNVPMFVGTMIHQLYSYAVGMGKSDDCHVAIIKLIEEAAGVEARAKE